MGMDTEYQVFVLESLSSEKERLFKAEGEILSRILTMLGKVPHYHYIRNVKELKAAIGLFEASGYRYLHISCHGDSDCIWFGDESLDFQEFCEIVGPSLKERRLFLSACLCATKSLAKPIIEQFKCFSVAGFNKEVSFSDAALLWGSFYNRMFNEDKKRMTIEPVIRALTNFSNAYDMPMMLFYRKRGKMEPEKIDPYDMRALLRRLNKAGV